LAVRTPELRRDFSAGSFYTAPTRPATPGICLSILPSTPRRWSTVNTKPAKFGLQFFNALAADLFNPLGG